MRKLVDAIYLENIDEVRTILENEPGLIDEKDEHGVLMALLAAKTGNIELVKYIVEYSRASMNIHDDNNNEIYTQLDRITDHLATMTKQERIAWFRRSAYAQPLNFTREIDGTVYAVRAFFKEDARENITDKVQRIVLNDTKSRKQT